MIQELAGNAVTGGLKFGTTLGGTDVVTAQAVAGSSLAMIADSALSKKIFSRTAEQIIYVDAVTGWNSAKVDVFFDIVKLW